MPWLTVAALTNIPTSQLVVSETATCLTEEGSLHSRTLTAGTLIIANSGATLGIAKILGIKCCANDGIAALLNLCNHVSANYVAHFINTKTSYLRNIVATGNGQPNLNTDLIGDLQVPLPPTKTEQEAIAETFSDADAFIESLGQLLAKKRDLKQGAMQELLTGKRRLPGFSGDWKMRRLAELASLYQPQTISQADFSPDGFPVYGANGIIGRYKFCNHNTWQITISCRGNCGTVNKTAAASWITGNAMVVNCDHNDDVVKEFLYYLLGNQDFSILVTGSGQPQIVRRPLAEFEVYLPADVMEQTAIAEVLTDMDADIATLEENLAKAHNLKQGMMQELLTGRIRLA
jgi:type I restriction enzyme S subunit